MRRLLVTDGLCRHELRQHRHDADQQAPESQQVTRVFAGIRTNESRIAADSAAERNAMR
jgi:hypothetical protein